VAHFDIVLVVLKFRVLLSDSGARGSVVGRGTML
jgi:hypothetical protein